MSISEPKSAKCPKCQDELTSMTPHAIPFDFCFNCEGSWLTPQSLALLLGVSSPPVADLSFTLPSEMFCPVCENRMMGHPYPSLENVLLLSCLTCEKLWLEAKEIQSLRHQVLKLKSSPSIRYAIQPKPIYEGSYGQWIFQLLTGLPIEMNNPRLNFPWVVFFLILVNTVVFGVIRFGPVEFPKIIYEYGFMVNDVVSGQRLYSIFTYMFLHANIFHLFFNLYFLFIFGDNLENTFGRFRFLLIYLISGVIAIFMQGMFASNAILPIVGASGAISGILGAYLIIFPHVKLYQIFLFFQFRVPIWLYGGIWLLLQIMYARLKIPGVAWYAHIGGFLAGIVMALGFRWRRFF